MTQFVAFEVLIEKYKVPYESFDISSQSSPFASAAVSVKVAYPAPAETPASDSRLLYMPFLGFILPEYPTLVATIVPTLV